MISLTVGIHAGRPADAGAAPGESALTQPNGTPWPVDATRLQVGDLLVDLRYRRINGPEQEVELPQRVFDLLLAFLAEPGVLHTRASLFERVWPGVVVEDANLSQSIWMLRKALGPERRDWIRTVPGSGYVFEPPGPVAEAAVPALDPDDHARPGGDAPSVPRVPDGAPLECDAGPPAGNAPTLALTSPGGEVPAVGARVPPPPTTRSWTRARVAVAGAVGILVALVAVVLLTPWRHGPAGRAPVAIALVEVGETHDRDTRWPGALLHAWLEFKLESTPEVTLLDESHLAADAGALTPTVVLLASGTAAGQPDLHFVRARIDGPDGPRQLERRGAAAEMPALVDALSAQVMAELLPSRTNEPWPTLAIDADAARAYADAYDRYARRDLAASVAGLRNVLERAPGFGLAHLQLAISLARLGQARPAITHIQSAGTLLAPLGDDARRVLDAAMLSVDPQRYMEAADAFNALARDFPERTGLRLDQAWYQFRAGQPDAALATLDAIDWQSEPASVRIRWHLTRADIAFAQGDAEGVLLHAGRTEALARAGGAGWERELAGALHLLALLDVHQRGDQADRSRFDEAVRLYEGIGAELDALYIRVSADLAAPPGDESAFETLLARAHAGGYRSVEIQLLRRSAFQHYAAGNLSTYRSRLEQARAAATAAGNPVELRALDMDLLGEDLLIGAFDQARKRIRSVRHEGLGSDQSVWLDQFEAFTLAVHGDFAGALEVLEQTPRRLQQQGLPALPDASRARLACARGDYLMQQGAMDQARLELDLCSRSADRVVQLRAHWLGAAIDQLSGDRPAAARRLDRLATEVEALPPSPDRWGNTIELGYLLDRNGLHEQATALYREAAHALEGTGYRWLQGHALLGLAESRTAVGDWLGAATYLRQARPLLGTDRWMTDLRMGLVELVLSLARDERKPAIARLVALHEQAHRLGDVPAQIALHGLVAADARLGPCDGSARGEQLAATGMRGGAVDWLTAALPEGQPLALE